MLTEDPHEVHFKSKSVNVMKRKMDAYVFNPLLCKPSMLSVQGIEQIERFDWMVKN